jgi:hypothetical protein
MPSALEGQQREEAGVLGLNRRATLGKEGLREERAVCSEKPSG